MSLKETTPEHYNLDGIDVITVLPKLFEHNHITDPTEGFLYGNALKYVWRLGAKGNRNEDIKKAIDYLERLMIPETPISEEPVKFKLSKNPQQE